MYDSPGRKPGKGSARATGRAQSLRPWPAMAVALAALFLSLSGSAAALQGQDQIDHDDLQSHVVHAGKIHNGAVNSAKVANNSLTAADIGEDAIQASELATIVARSNFVTIANNDDGSVTASCEPGEIVISGGGHWGSTFTGASVALYKSERAGNGWQVGGWNLSGSSSTLFAEAYCLVP